MNAVLPDASPEYFMTHTGVDAATAVELSRQAGYRPPEIAAPQSSPIARTPTAPPPVAVPTAEAIEARLERYASAGLKRTQAQVEEELRVEGQLESFKGNRQAQWDLANDSLAAQAEESFQRSVDAHMQPATAAHQYNIPGMDSPEAVEFVAPFRQAMFDAGLSVEIGNTIARQVNETAGILLDATDEQVDLYMAEQEATLRNLWGPAFESRKEMVRSFLYEQGQRSPALKAVLTDHPEVFSDWKTVEAFAKVAEHQKRVYGRK